jgi:4-aminobutyrate aminotransferase-like enzyme
MFRTGKFLAAQHFDVQPDVVILAKEVCQLFCVND